MILLHEYREYIVVMSQTNNPMVPPSTRLHQIM